jgi:hypothetical protein
MIKYIKFKTLQLKFQINFFAQKNKKDNTS